MPLLTDPLQDMLRQIARKKCLATRETLLLELGGTSDHIHLAVKIPPTLPLSRWVGETKGLTSHEINQTFGNRAFGWQVGYGIVSFSERDLGMITNYIKNQKEHHSTGNLYPYLEKTGESE